MKKIFSALIMFLLTVISGCTQYNGHIGPIFGSWSLTGMTDDGVEVDLQDETVFSFQNEIVRITRPSSVAYSTEMRFGNFSLEGDVLTMRFQGSPTSTGSKMYMAPDWLHFPQDGKPFTLDVGKLNSSEMQFYLHSGGETYSYTFKKTW